MSVIITAVVSVTVIGLICAIVLNVASKLMYVKVDMRVTQLIDVMPGANCGACGYPGCEGFAVALAAGEAKTNLCPPGGPELIKKISEILGIEGESIEKKIAVIRCLGSDDAKQKKMEYKGIPSCAGANQLYGGQCACGFGCLGYGDCLKVCPTNAICMETGLAHIIKDLCTGCGLCIKACPNRLITIENESIPVLVACINIEKGAIVRKKCKYGCIACTKCVKECPDGAIVIEDNLAKIDYAKCSGCGKCADVCMTKCIVKNKVI
ncbi:MAG: RnfABCDGE type electron transport complex subunit B [Treponema sp.]|nr:RnfABCDGE type electron transport complex subunit B [Treponema sp.]